MADDIILTYTLDEALTLAGFGRFQILVLLYAGLGSLSGAMEVMILSFVGPSFKNEWGLSSIEESLITVAVFVGMLIGAYFWGVISDNFGRRMGLLLVATVTSTSAFLSSFSPGYRTMVFLRMLVGIGASGGQVYCTWFLEFVPAGLRGTWMVFYSTFWTLGTILEASLAWVIMPRLGWRWLLALTSVPSVVVLIFCVFVMETPRYLYMECRKDDVYNILKKIAAVNQMILPSALIILEENFEPDDETPLLRDSRLVSSTKKKRILFDLSFLSVFKLLSPRLAKTTLLLWVVFFGNSFMYYGVILITSELSSGQSKGCFTILHSINGEDVSLYRNAFITSLAELPGLVLSAITVDGIGRKASIAFLYMLAFIFLLPLLVHQHEILTTMLLFGGRMCFLGTFTVAGIYCPEIYPTSARTTGLGVANAIGNIAGMICPIVITEMMTHCNQVPAIILIEFIIILSVIGVLLLPLETKGRELVDTVTMFPDSAQATDLGIASSNTCNYLVLIINVAIIGVLLFHLK